MKTNRSIITCVDVDVMLLCNAANSEAQLIQHVNEIAMQRVMVTAAQNCYSVPLTRLAFTTATAAYYVAIQCAF